MKKSAVILALVAIAIPFNVQAATPLAGMPPVTDPNNIYAADGPNNFSPVVANFPERVYVPNHTGNSVTEIDPKTFKVIRTFSVPKGPQHRSVEALCLYRFPLDQRSK